MAGPRLVRSAESPVLVPRAEHDEAAVYNPGAMVIEGTLFLLPRIRRLSTRESALGLAWSEDGASYERLSHPIMMGSQPYERPIPSRPRETGGV